VPRTLVTGATGFIGSHVTALLVERGDDVEVMVRDGSRVEALAGLDVKPVRADVLDRRSIRRAMRGVERLFHIAGTTNLAAPRAQLFGLNVEGAQVVLEEALRAGVERAVYTSSVAAIGPARPGESADENNAWTAGRYAIAYLDAKHEAETAALRLIARGLPLVIVNPAHVLGAGDPGRSSTVLVRRFMRRQIPAYVDGTLNVVGVQDVARGHLLADERGAVGERYILGNRNFTMDRLFADLGRLSGIEPPAVKLPLSVALALSATGSRIAGGVVPSTTEVRATSLNWSFVNRKAKRELGWTTSPHEDCLEETVAYYRERDGDRIAPPGARQPLALRIAGAMLRRVGL
jgi:dihydroflavonol-4-reductase